MALMLDVWDGGCLPADTMHVICLQIDEKLHMIFLYILHVDKVIKRLILLESLYASPSGHKVIRCINK